MYKVLEFYVEGKIKGTRGFFNKKEGHAIIFNEYSPRIIEEEKLEEYIKAGKEILQQRFESMVDRGYIYDEKFGSEYKYKIEKNVKMEMEVTLVTYKDAGELKVEELRKIATVKQFKEIMG